MSLFDKAMRQFEFALEHGGLPEACSLLSVAALHEREPDKQRALQAAMATAAEVMRRESVASPYDAEE